MTSYRLAGASALLLGLLSAVPAMAQESGIPGDASNFYKSDRVIMQPVTFPNQYKMTIAGDLFVPKGMNPGQKHAAIIVGHPMGAVKEQSACLYATKMAEQGFVTLAVDLSFWGGSSGQPRNAVSPDLYAETFSAAADFLGTRPFVDRDKIEPKHFKKWVDFAKKYGCILVLKGANTVVAAPDSEITFNTTGNPGMSTGGSGDVLAGITVSLLAQGLEPLAASKAAVYLHGEAGDKAAEKRGERAMLPTDLIEEL